MNLAGFVNVCSNTYFQYSQLCGEWELSGGEKWKGQEGRQGIESL